MKKILEVIIIIFILVIAHLFVENWNELSYVVGIVVGLFITDLFDGDDK